MKPNPSAAADRLKDLGLLYDAAFQNSDYEWQGKQYTEAYERLYRVLEAQQTDDSLSDFKTRAERLRGCAPNLSVYHYIVVPDGRIEEGKAFVLMNRKEYYAKIKEVHEAAYSPQNQSDTLSELRTQIEAKMKAAEKEEPK